VKARKMQPVRWSKSGTGAFVRTLRKAKAEVNGLRRDNGFAWPHENGFAGLLVRSAPQPPILRPATWRARKIYPERAPTHPIVVPRNNAVSCRPKKKNKKTKANLIFDCMSHIGIERPGNGDPDHEHAARYFSFPPNFWAAFPTESRRSWGLELNKRV